MGKVGPFLLIFFSFQSILCGASVAFGGCSLPDHLTGENTKNVLTPSHVQFCVKLVRF
jgi:hypothetical protein